MDNLETSLSNLMDSDFGNSIGAIVEIFIEPKA